MAPIIINMRPGQANVTGIGLLAYADKYRQAAVRLKPKHPVKHGVDIVLLYLLCQCLEFQLKAFLWARGQTRLQLKDKYGHQLAKLWNDAKSEGIEKYAETTALRQRVIAKVDPYYSKKRLTYIDSDMLYQAVTGYKDLASEPKTLSVLYSLTGRLSKTLYEPVAVAT